MNSWDKGSIAEQKLITRMQEFGYFVVPATQFHANTGLTKAPMVGDQTGALIAPDLLCIAPMKGTQFWLESKSKAVPSWRRMRAQWEHGVDFAAFAQYQQTEARSRIPLVFAVNERSAPAYAERDSDLVACDQWLFISYFDAEKYGEHRADWPGGKADPRRRGKDGRGGWLWPRNRMSLRLPSEVQS